MLAKTGCGEHRKRHADDAADEIEEQKRTPQFRDPKPFRHEEEKQRRRYGIRQSIEQEGEDQPQEVSVDGEKPQTLNQRNPLPGQIRRFRHLPDGKRRHGRQGNGEKHGERRETARVTSSSYRQGKGQDDRNQRSDERRGLANGGNQRPAAIIPGEFSPPGRVRQGCARIEKGQEEPPEREIGKASTFRRPEQHEGGKARCRCEGQKNASPPPPFQRNPVRKQADQRITDRIEKADGEQHQTKPRCRNAHSLRIEGRHHHVEGQRHGRQWHGGQGVKEKRAPCGKAHAPHPGQGTKAA